MSNLDATTPLIFQESCLQILESNQRVPIVKETVAPITQEDSTHHLGLGKTPYTRKPKRPNVPSERAHLHRKSWDPQIH